MKNTLGELEHLVLLAVLRLEDEAYGVAILRELSGTAQRKTTRAAVYVALKRLEERGLLDSRLAAPTAERGGRAKRYYHLQPPGLDVLRSSQATLQRMWAGLEDQLGT